MLNTLLVVAHTDDESAAASKLVCDNRENLILLHATDSAPLNPEYARRAGFENRDEYRAARRAELLEAMAVAGLPPQQCIESKVAIPDLEATRNIRIIARSIASILGWHPIGRIYTHAYEGGHPDHDSVALAARLAVDATRDAGGREVELWEFPEYHAASGSLIASEFIPFERVAVTRYDLSGPEQARKREMLECFRSQKRILERFPLEFEVVRPAPRYDFSRPPHEGQLYYESRPMGWSGSEWRRFAGNAMRG